jgi:transcriptional regulator with XRE-family HTH domain
MERRSLPPSDSFAARFDSLMKEKRLGVREAARIAKLPSSTIMGWKTGRAPRDFVALKRLAKALGTTLSFLLTGENDSAANDALVRGEVVFEGYAYVKIQRLGPRASKTKSELATSSIEIIPAR